jgi:RecB family endonuclease NucS
MKKRGINMVNNIYDFEKNLTSSVLVEKNEDTIRYDIRTIAQLVEELGRPLTNEEAKRYILQ